MFCAIPDERLWDRDRTVSLLGLWPGRVRRVPREMLEQRGISVLFIVDVYRTMVLRSPAQARWYDYVVLAVGYTAVYLGWITY